MNVLRRIVRSVRAWWLRVKVRREARSAFRYDYGQFLVGADTQVRHAVGVLRAYRELNDGHADREAHALLGIPEHEAIVQVIACGIPPEEFDVASSPRRPVSDILVDAEGQERTVG